MKVCKVFEFTWLNMLKWLTLNFWGFGVYHTRFAVKLLTLTIQRFHILDTFVRRGYICTPTSQREKKLFIMLILSIPMTMNTFL